MKVDYIYQMLISKSEKNPKVHKNIGQINCKFSLLKGKKVGILIDCALITTV